MLTLKVLGSTSLQTTTGSVKVSAKGLALLVYLTLEDRPIHRETLANLLWPTGGGLGSLRVELSKLRQAGVDLSPGRAPLLRCTLPTDLAQLEHAVTGTTWQQVLRGPPLGGLDDAMCPELLPWLHSQRTRISAQVQHALQGALAHAAQHGHTAQVALLRERAEAAGVTLVSPPEVQAFHPARALAGPLEQDLLRATRLAERAPHLLVLVGRHGSGRREMLQAALEGHPWPVAHLDAVGHPTLLVMSLMMRLLPLLREDLKPALHALMARSLPAPEAMTALSALLLEANAPLTVVMYGAEALSDEVAPLFDFALNWPLPFLLVLVTTDTREAALMQLLGRHVRPERFTLSRSRPLAAPDLHAPHLSAPGPAAERHLFQVARQSEGWATAALALLPLPAPLPQRVPMPPEVRAVLIGEAYQALGSHLAVLAPLAALPGPFSVELALHTLRRVARGSGAEQSLDQQALERALQAGLLERVPAHLDVALPSGRFSVPDGDHPLAFRSELQRAALAGTLDSALRASLRQSSAESPSTSEVCPGVVPFAVQSTLARSAFSGLPETTVSPPGGYRLHVAPDLMTVLRLGARGHRPPELRLHVPTPPGARHWQFSFCLETPYSSADVFPLWLLGSTEAATLTPISVPESGLWYAASGELSAPGSPLVLGVRAHDLILHLADFAFPSTDSAPVQHI
ncbi:hypothetical protein [Deinococcus puniceus]|uniref:Bacterial transcriptional activator domain-containing protein n=1 Tax=Deinococcus puniceus TaxID=1182568 RepID=A0A172T9B0_9DEIO|nr:hypothetical protein [Deinococcus puniceus]ANE43609.1 hypothetical protein SU48_07320 [Deinococcus puniceus]